VTTTRKTHPGVRRQGALVAAAAMATAATLVLAPGASARPEQVSGGTTSLKISANVGEFLADAGTKVKAIDPAKEKKNGYGFPIATGELDNKKVKGSLKHRGGLEVNGDGGKFELTRLQAKFGRSSKLKAKVDGDNSALFELDTENAKAKESDGTIKVSGVKVLLSAKGVRLIEDVTEMELEDRDVVFGKLKVAAETGGEELNLTGGDANLALDNAFTSGGVSASAIDPATEGAGRIGFPVAGGNVSADGGSGSVRLDGGLRLTRGGTNLDLTRPRIGLADGEITAVVSGDRVALASFNPAGATVEVDGEDVRITGVDSALTADGERTINQALGGNAFAEGDPFGTFEVQATSG
jgi:Htaa